ncbi:hypothetical protein AB4Y72_15005 [Arthrobacter sp. YAF34]|uniref:hypothetical protein n=1 Tax=Arthrobacter sp. YAF34 TaxID=3233083 RepID=UPI003F8EABE5
MTTQDDLTREQRAASAEYNKLQRQFEEIHLAYEKGEATIEHDRAADEVRRVALRKFRQLMGDD